MKNRQALQHPQQQDVNITGWEEGILMPRNMNVSQFSTIYPKGFAQVNRKQFVQRRRKCENQNVLQHFESLCQDSHRNQPKIQLSKKYTTINNDNYSSINQLRRQMQNIEKIKNRWQQGSTSEVNSKSNNLVKISRSGLIQPYQSGREDQNQDFDIARMYVRQVNSCRSNRKRPISSFRQNGKHSMALSQKNNERSKTIHSRGSNRLFSCKNRNLKLRSKSNNQKLNIVINQIEGKKMQSILKILWNHS